jgi:hypothetical protein
MMMNDGPGPGPGPADDPAAAAAPVELAVDHPSILRPDAAAAVAAAAAAVAASSGSLLDSSSSGRVSASPVDATNPQPGSDGGAGASSSNPQQVALPPPGKRYRSTPAKTFQCKGFGDCRMVFSRSEHLARHIRYVLFLDFSTAHPRPPPRARRLPRLPDFFWTPELAPSLAVLSPSTSTDVLLSLILTSIVFSPRSRSHRVGTSPACGNNETKMIPSTALCTSCEPRTA